MGANDEMCNLYLMYYTKKENAVYRKCWANNYPKGRYLYDVRKFSHFWTPSPSPLSHTKSADFVAFVCFLRTPSPTL